MPEDDDAVFKALADPSRRRLLDLLFDRDGQTLGELEEEFAMSRFGVMKHVRVLEEAGLVVTRKDGRATRHFLNPIPIQLVADRWVDKYRAERVTALVDLKTALESRQEPRSMSADTTHLPAGRHPRRGDRDAGLPHRHQGHPAGDLGRHHAARVHRRYFHGAAITITPDRYASFGPDGVELGRRRGATSGTRRTGSSTAGRRSTTRRWRRRPRAG